MKKLEIFTVVRKGKEDKRIRERIASFTTLETADDLKRERQEDNISYFDVVKSDVYSTLDGFYSEQDEEIAEKALAALDENSRSAIHRYFSRRWLNEVKKNEK